jgi:glycosyltransferase involved in cell wall biosynthesis
LLEPVYRGVVYPLLVGTADVTIVHSRFAADLLARLGGRPRRLEVIPHPAPYPERVDRQVARDSLGLAPDRLLAVLPGVIKSAKLVREAVLALGSPSVRRDWRLVLAGPIRDARAATEARRAGALVLDHPDDRSYEAAIVAADVVLCLRSGSVGETNGPLLDALGAGRPVLATATGSLPEVAADAARYVRPTAAGIAGGLRALADESERARRSAAARTRAAELSWEASAVAHAELFREVFRA